MTYEGTTDQTYWAGIDRRCLLTRSKDLEEICHKTGFNLNTQTMQKELDAYWKVLEGEKEWVKWEKGGGGKGWG